MLDVTKLPYWIDYCNYINDNRKNFKEIPSAILEGYYEWRKNQVKINIIEFQQEIINDSITQVEDSLDLKEFEDYCDNVSTLIAYLNKTKKVLR